MDHLRNQYLGDGITRFSRTDQWKHIPWADEKPKFNFYNFIMYGLAAILCVVAFAVVAA